MDHRKNGSFVLPLLLNERPAVYIVKIAGTMNTAANPVNH